MIHIGIATFFLLRKAARLSVSPNNPRDQCPAEFPAANRRILFGRTTAYTV